MVFDWKRKLHLGFRWKRCACSWLALTGTSSAEDDMYAVALLSYFTCLLFLICSLTGAARLCSSLSHQFTRCYGKPSQQKHFTWKKLKIKISAPFWFDWTVSAASRGCRPSWWNNEMFLLLFFVLYEPLKVIYSRNRVLAVCSHFGIALACCCWLWSFCLGLHLLWAFLERRTFIFFYSPLIPDQDQRGAGAYSIKERQTSTHDHFTHTDILESPISLTCITLDCGRNLENPKQSWGFKGLKNRSWVCLDFWIFSYSPSKQEHMIQIKWLTWNLFLKQTSKKENSINTSC